MGTPITATVIVGAEPLAVATPASQNVCSNVAITPVVLTTSNNLSGTTFTWTRDNTTSVTGIAASGSGDITGTLVNITGVPQTVVFTIIPTTAGCVGTAITATIIVGAEPLAVATPSTQNQCSDVAITTIVLSTSNNLTGTTYAWTRDNIINVTGVAASGTGDISGTLTNATNVPQTVIFTITPTSAGLCVGTPITATVIIAPKATTSVIYHN